MNKDKLAKFKKQIKVAIADYMSSEGCGCCGDRNAHREHEQKLGKLLGIPKYKDGSGYDFGRYKTQKD